MSSSSLTLVILACHPEPLHSGLLLDTRSMENVVDVRFCQLAVWNTDISTFPIGTQLKAIGRESLKRKPFT